MKKSYCIVRLKFQNYTTSPFRAELTPAQFDSIGAMLLKQRKVGTLKSYYLGPPAEAERVHAMVLSAEALKSELTDLIEMERRVETNS